MGIETFVRSAMLALTLTAGCQTREEQERREAEEEIIKYANEKYANEQGIPIEYVEYQRPDDVILQVWESLKTLNNGQPYEIKVQKDSPRELYHLCFDGEGFRYNVHVEEITEDGMRRGVTSQMGTLYGNPYKSEGAVLAERLRESPIRQTLLTAYEHRTEMIPYTCSL